MKLTILTALMAFAVATTRAFAQSTPEGVDANCERAWLAYDWPTVAVECSNMADANEQSANNYKAQAVEFSTSNASLSSQAANFIGPDLLFAGAAHARAAVAYAHLHKTSLYSEARADAIKDIAGAKGFFVQQPELHDRAAGLLWLLQSKDFVKTAPDSDLLGHI
jgi:hypothetical protein